MATIKAFSDLEQSKVLAKILPLESADMYWSLTNQNHPPVIGKYCAEYGGMQLPAWSLAALLNVLPFPQLSKDKLGSGKVGWMVSVYPDNCRYDSCWHDNPIDACYEMILKLHDNNLL